EDVFFSAHKNKASYFLKDQEIVSSWFIPYESQQESLLKNPTLFQTAEESAPQESGNFGYGYGYESAFVEDEEVEDKEIVCRETRPLLARLLREQDRQFVFALLRQQFLSTERTKEISSGEIERATTHYFQGDDVSSWRVGVESTQMVQYTNLYPSIDLQILSDGAGLTQSFVVHPGGNPEDIRSRWRGARGMGVLKNGDLAVNVGACDVVFERPYVQDEDGVIVKAAYKILGSDGLTFEISPYNIDKVLSLFIKVSEERTTCVKRAILEEDVAVLPGLEETYYIVGNLASPLRFPLQEDEYQCIEGKTFDPQVTLYDFEEQQTIFQTTFGGSGAEEITSIS